MHDIIQQSLKLKQWNITPTHAYFYHISKLNLLVFSLITFDWLEEEGWLVTRIYTVSNFILVSDISRNYAILQILTVFKTVPSVISWCSLHSSCFFSCAICSQYITAHGWDGPNIASTTEIRSGITLIRNTYLSCSYFSFSIMRQKLWICDTKFLFDLLYQTFIILMTCNVCYFC